MKDHSGCRRAFHWSTKAYHHCPSGQPEVIFGMFHTDGSTSGEMAMRWEKLGNRLVPQLQVFNDAWSALALFPDLIERLGNLTERPLLEEEFVELLLDCGFEDITQYESPRERLHKEESLAAEKLLRIVQNAGGDNLERANIAFRGLSREQMQEDYGGSGQTRQTILDGYRCEREEWQAAKELLIKLFRAAQIRYPFK